jgi:hypothetical protein
VANTTASVLGNAPARQINHEKMVFVFGSNLAGRHGKGAALTAKRFFGAVDGVGIGFSGHSYALPTKDARIETLPLSAIEEQVERFLAFAAETPSLEFMVTRVGCGLAGYSDGEISALFWKHNVPVNVHLPGIWLAANDPSLPARVIIAGGRDFADYELLFSRCESLLSRLQSVTIVSGGAKGADALGEQFCTDMTERGKPYSLVRFPAAWDDFGKTAGMLRNAAMAHYATHLIAFWDGQSSGTRNMLALAESEKLSSRVIRY